MHFLVTGANGLLGRAMVDYLLGHGEQVRAFDLVPYDDPRVESVVGDLRDAEVVHKACAGVDAVLHLASVVYVGLGRPQYLYDINVQGTQNLIDACRAQGVGRFVYTSSIDVVFAGQHIRDGDERLPYARRHLDYYGETKMLAEKLVLAANDPDNLLTCSLRTAGIYGPGDRHRFPPLVEQARQGRLVRIGDGRARFNHVYVENAAHAHYLAACALEPGSMVAGKAYFITDDPPGNFFDFTLNFLEALGYPAPRQRVPGWLAAMMARALEWRWRLRPSDGHANVVLTRYAVASLCRDFWFSSEKAHRDFNYVPIVDSQTAFTRTLEWMRAQGWQRDSGQH